MRMLLSGSFLLLIATTVVHAQSKVPVVEAHVLIATDAAHANSSVKLAVIAQVAAGYHVNAHKPTLDYLIPTELKMEPSEQFVVKSVVYPAGMPKKFEFSDAPLSVYQGSVVVGAVLHTARDLAPGTYTVKGKLAYQACSDHACLPPTSVPLAVAIRIVAPNIPLKPVESDVFQRIKFE